MSVNFNKELTLKRAELYLQQNQINSAIDEYKKIVETTKDINLMNLLGDLYIRIGDNEKAINCFIPVAEEYSAMDFNLKAIAMYKKIYKLDTNNKVILLKIADLHVKNKHPMEAINLYNQVLESYKSIENRQGIIKVLKRIVKLEPENISKKQELASNYQLEGLFSEAENIYLEIGEKLLGQQKLEEAIKIFDKILFHNPIHKTALKNQVNALLQAKQVERSLEIIKKAIEKNFEDMDFFVLLGKTYLSLNKLDEAEKTFIDLVTKDSSRYAYLLEIAKVFLVEKEFDRTVGLIELFIDVILEKKQKRKITNLLTEILKQDPNHLKTIKCLAYIYRKLQEKGSLISTLKMLVKTALSHGEEKEAIEALNSLIELESDNESYKKELENIKNSSISSKNFTNLLQSTVKDSKSQLTNKFLKTESEINADPTSTQELLEGMMAGNISYLDAQQNLLEAMVAAYPDYLEARIKLKNIYLQKDLKQKAAQECLEIAKIYKELNQKEKAKKTLKEAYENDPTLRKDAIDSQETFGDSDEKIVSKETELLTDPKISNITAQQSKLPSEVISCHNKNNTEVDLTSIFSNQVVTNPPISNKIAAQKLPNESLSPLSFVDITFLQEKNALLDREWRRAVRSNEEISLVAVKIDGFMDYLWNLGEAFIEECRTKILKAIQDTLFRGGDQVVNCIRKDILILILPDTSREGAILIVERINSSIAKIKLDQLNSSLTLSQVIASAKPKRNNNPSILLEQLVNNYSKLTTNNQII